MQAPSRSTTDGLRRRAIEKAGGNPSRHPILEAIHLARSGVHWGLRAPARSDARDRRPTRGRTPRSDLVCAPPSKKKGRQPLSCNPARGPLANKSKENPVRPAKDILGRLRADDPGRLLTATLTELDKQIDFVCNATSFAVVTIYWKCDVPLHAFLEADASFRLE